MPSQLSLPFEPEHFNERPEILVLGDCLEDIWIDCSEVKLSAEAPVLAAKPYSTERLFPGGAGNIASNLEAMGWKVQTVLQPHSTHRPWNTPIKTRYRYNNQQIFRVDNFDQIHTPISEYTLLGSLDRAAALGLPVVVADYNKGALTDELRWLIDPRKYSGVPAWYVHTKLSPHKFTSGDAANKSIAWFYNQKEFSGFHNNETFFYKPIIITKGAEGAIEICKDITRAVNTPIPGPVRSTCGAGDVFMAAYVTAKELYGHPNPLAIADAIAKKTVTECDYTCCYRGGF